MPFHLLFPLFSSVVFVVGMVIAKNAIGRGVSPWTSTFLGNCWLAAFWVGFGILHGEWLPVAGWWQAAIVGLCFVLGQMFTYLAFQHGDVSVATPIFGVKVIIVAGMIAVFAKETVPVRVWIGAVLATIGVACVQAGTRSVAGKSELTTRKALMTVLMALSAAVALSFFDIGLQTWGRRWGSAEFLPVMFIATGLLSCVFLPWVDRPTQLLRLKATTATLVGTMLIAIQAISMSYSLSVYGDATRINIVYALRGLWAVILAWAVARLFGGNESLHSARVMGMRLFGALLLTVSVIVALMGGS